MHVYPLHTFAIEQGHEELNTVSNEKHMYYKSLRISEVKQLFAHILHRFLYLDTIPSTYILILRS